jgi:hypothetical protein
MYQPVEGADDLETRRIMFDMIFHQNEEITLFISTDHRNVITKGYVESIECNFFNNPQIIQVSIICPDPFFYAADDNGDIDTHTDALEYMGLLLGKYFAFNMIYTVYGMPDASVGFILRFTAASCSRRQDKE